MPERAEDIKEKLEQFLSFPLDESLEEKVESLWREHMGRGSHMDADLSEAKARRAQAEATREQAELEAVRTTQALCDRMRAKAEQELKDATGLRAEAQNAHRGAEADLKAATETKEQAEREREHIISDAEKRAQDLIEQARTDAQQETTELRRQAFKEIKTILTRVETMHAAVSEELETQRILTNVAKLKTSPRRMLAESMVDVDGEGLEDLGADAGEAAKAAGAAQPGAKEKKSSGKR